MPFMVPKQLCLIGVGITKCLHYRRLVCMLGNPKSLLSSLNSSLHPICFFHLSTLLSSLLKIQNGKNWVFPKKSFIKINTHAVYYSHPLPNGNISGLGIVLRDHKGTIILMVSGTIPEITDRANELWAFLIGLRCAFHEEEYRIQIETDNAEAVKEWDDWRWFVDPNHAGVIQQLLQRSSDPNLFLDKVQVVEASQNRLARYLAEDGAFNQNRLVAFHRPFGMVKELWRLDMGLGPLAERFMVVEEVDFVNMQAEEEEVPDLGDLLVQGIGSPNTGFPNANA